MFNVNLVVVSWLAINSKFVFFYRRTAQKKWTTSPVGPAVEKHWNMSKEQGHFHWDGKKQTHGSWSCYWQTRKRKEGAWGLFLKGLISFKVNCFLNSLPECSSSKNRISLILVTTL